MVLLFFKNKILFIVSFFFVCVENHFTREYLISFALFTPSQFLSLLGLVQAHTQIGLPFKAWPIQFLKREFRKGKYNVHPFPTWRSLIGCLEMRLGYLVWLKTTGVILSEGHVAHKAIKLPTSLNDSQLPS